MPCYNTAPYKRLQRVLRRQCSYTTHAIKQRTELYRGVSGNLPCFAAVVWLVHLPILHRLCHAGAYHSAAAPSAQPDTTVTQGRCTGQHSRPIIIRYIRAQRCAPVMDPCQTVQHTTDHASPAGSAPAVCGSLASDAPGAPAEGVSVSTCTGSARRRSRYFPRPAAGDLAPGQRSGRTGWHPPPGGAVQQQVRGWRRGTIGGYRRISFRAFAR